MNESTAVARERRSELDRELARDRDLARTPFDLLSARLAPTLGYMFSMRLEIAGRPLGEVPGGFRLDLEYVAGKVETRADLYHRAWLADRIPLLEERFARLAEKNGEKIDPPGRDATPATWYRILQSLRRRRGASEHPLQELQNHQDGLEWFGFDGDLLAGHDWALVRDDGVVQLGSRVTILSHDEEQAVVEASLTGNVDLRAAAGAPALSDAGDVFQRWRAGGLKQAIVPVALAASFTSATRIAESWAPARMKRQGEGAWKLARLLRGQFVAVGQAALGASRLSPLELVTLDVYEVGVGSPP